MKGLRKQYHRSLVDSAAIETMPSGTYLVGDSFTRRAILLPSGDFEGHALEITCGLTAREILHAVGCAAYSYWTP